MRIDLADNSKLMLLQVACPLKPCACPRIANAGKAMRKVFVKSGNLGNFEKSMFGEVRGS